MNLFLLALLLVLASDTSVSVSSDQAVSIAENTCGSFSKDLKKFPWHTKLENGNWWVWKDVEGNTLLQTVDAKNGKSGECAFWGCSIPGLSSEASCGTEKSN